VQVDEEGVVSASGLMTKQQLWTSGGFFVLRPEIFDNLCHPVHAR
jgi:hypothetical protein